MRLQIHFNCTKTYQNQYLLTMQLICFEWHIAASVSRPPARVTTIQPAGILEYLANCIISSFTLGSVICLGQSKAIGCTFKCSVTVTSIQARPMSSIGSLYQHKAESGSAKFSITLVFLSGISFKSVVFSFSSRKLPQVTSTIERMMELVRHSLLSHSCIHQVTYCHFHHNIG